MPAAAVIRRIRALSGFIRFKGCVGGRVSQLVKSGGSTIQLPLILKFLNMVEVGGMCCVAVKCIDMTQNADCEGSLLSHY